MVVPLRSQARLWHSLLHWGLRTGLRFAGPVFRGCGALRAVLTPSPLRGFDGFGLFRAQRAAFVRPAYGGPVFRRCGPPFRACPRASSRFAALACALRVLAPPAASRPPTASDRDGNAFLPTVRNRRSTSHAKRACGSRCSLGLLRPVSATGGGLRAPRKNARNDVHAVISDLSLVLPILCQGSVIDMRKHFFQKSGGLGLEFPAKV